MNKMFKLALSVVLGATLVAPAFAQSNFPDVPMDHWAYNALRNLKDKVLFGYPNTEDYRGNRPMSRYEFAAAADKLYQIMMGKFQSVDSQIANLEKMIRDIDTGPKGEFATKAEVQALRDQLDSLRKALDGKADKSAVDEIRKLVGEFDDELSGLGRNVSDMQNDLSDLKARLDGVEARIGNLKITGVFDVLMLGGTKGHADGDSQFGLMWWGTSTGVGRGNYTFVPTGVNRDLTILHSAQINMETTIADGAKVNAGLLIGNTMGSIGTPTGGNSVYPVGEFGIPGPSSFSEDPTSIVFDHFAVNFDGGLLGQNFKASLGRVGHSVSPYIMARPDFTPYYNNMRFDDGKQYFDGGILTFNFGNTALNFWGGRNSSLMDDDGLQINRLAFGFNGNPTLVVDQSLGADLSIPLGNTGSLKLAYAMFDTNTAITMAAPNGEGGRVNRLNVYGADVDLKFGDLSLRGQVSKSDYSENTSSRINDDNMAWDVSLGWSNSDRWGLNAGYRHVEENFAAPGDWGRIGIAWNPTNIEGFNAGVWFKPNNDVKIYARGEFVEGVNETNAGITGISFSEGDRLNSFIVGVDYRLGPTWSTGLSYEQNRFEFDGSDDSKFSWINLNFGWNISENSNFRFGYIHSDHSLANGGVLNGGLFTTQVSVRF